MTRPLELTIEKYLPQLVSGVERIAKALEKGKPVDHSVVSELKRQRIELEQQLAAALVAVRTASTVIAELQSRIPVEKIPEEDNGSS